MKKKKIIAAITLKDLMVILLTEVEEHDVVVITTKNVDGKNSYIIEIN
jgi:hypothetical protein